MDPSDKIARRALEDERLARPVTYLTKFQKTVLKDVAVDIYDSDGVPHQSPEAGALESLSSLGLVSLRSTKEGIGGQLTEKGRLLLHENPKLRFSPPEGKRWKITTTIAIVALVIALGSLIVAALSLILQFGR